MHAGVRDITTVLNLNHIGVYTCIIYSTISGKFSGGFSVEAYSRSALDVVVSHRESAIFPDFLDASEDLHRPTPVDTALYISNKYF